MAYLHALTIVRALNKADSLTFKARQNGYTVEANLFARCNAQALEILSEIGPLDRATFSGLARLEMALGEKANYVSAMENADKPEIEALTAVFFSLSDAVQFWSSVRKWSKLTLTEAESEMLSDDNNMLNESLSDIEEFHVKADKLLA